MKRKMYLSANTANSLAESPEDNTDLMLLLNEHSQVVLDITYEELEMQENALLIILHQQRGTFSYGHHPSWQYDLDSVVVADAAGTVFVLNQDAAECEQISKKYGVCAINPQSVLSAAYLLKPLARRELLKTDTYQAMIAGNQRQGWHAALTVPELPITKVPLNALVIIDTYLFGDKGRFLPTAIDNLACLLQALLPPTLSIDFHLLLVATNTLSPFDKAGFESFNAEIERRVNRPYPIRIGLVTRPPGGKERRSITGNYYFCTSQHGFSCFNVNAKPNFNNDFIANGAFEGADTPGFHLPVRSMSTELRTAQTLLKENLEFQSKPDVHDHNRQCLGFYDNRLLTLVP